MGTKRTRYLWLGLAVSATAALLVAAPGVVQRQQAAHAEQIRRRCIREFSARGAWRAEITQTEMGSDGTSSVVRHELLVRKPGEYRLILRERDTKGRAVVSTTVRTREGFYTRRTNADGSSELHIMRNARPTLGVELDNLLGQTVRSLADAAPLRIAGSGSRHGITADKLELGPGRFVWVDQKTGLPIEEQVVSGGHTARSVVIDSFEEQPPPPQGEFDPATLGSVDATTVEDLGFRPVGNAAAAAPKIGFAPLETHVPEGFSVDLQGYVDPAVSNGDAPVEAAFVCALSNGSRGVIVTQVARPGTGDSFVPAPGDGDSFSRVEVAGVPAAYFHDGTAPRLVFARRGVLVTIEGDLTASGMKQLAESMSR